MAPEESNLDEEEIQGILSDLDAILTESPSAPPPQSPPPVAPPQPQSKPLEAAPAPTPATLPVENAVPPANQAAPAPNLPIETSPPEAMPPSLATSPPPRSDPTPPPPSTPPLSVVLVPHAMLVTPTSTVPPPAPAGIAPLKLELSAPLRLEPAAAAPVIEKPSDSKIEATPPAPTAPPKPAPVKIALQPAEEPSPAPSKVVESPNAAARTAEKEVETEAAQPPASPTETAPPPEGEAGESADGIPADAPQSQIRMVAVAYTPSCAQARDAFVPFLDECAKTVSKKPLYLRKVAISQVDSNTDATAFAQKAAAAGAVAVIAVLEGLAETNISDLEGALKAAGLLFRYVGPDAADSRSAAIDILVELMMLAPRI